MPFILQNRHWCHRFSIAVDDKMAAKLFYSQNKSSSGDSDTVRDALDSVQYAEKCTVTLAQGEKG